MGTNEEVNPTIYALWIYLDKWHLLVNFQAKLIMLLITYELPFVDY